MEINRVKNRRLCQRILVLIMLVSLSACGFKMRGDIVLPEAMKKIYLEGASRKLRDAFKTSIERAHGEIVTAQKEASIILIILEEDLNKRSVSLSARGRSTEIELNYYVVYELRDAQDKVLVAEQTIEIIKDFFDNQVDIIAKDVEGNIIRGEIYQQAVRQMIDKSRFELKKRNLQP